MQPATYFFASLSSFLGILIGSVLIRIAPEEQKPLGKYFILIKKILLALAFAFLLLFYFGKWLYFIGLTLLAASTFLTEYKAKSMPNRLIAAYIILGILFFLSSKNINLLAIESSIVLLYGTAAASLEFDKKKPFKMFFYGIGFVTISSILYLVTISHF